MASVFLSYAREDLSKAEPLAAALEGLGHSVWWDRRLHGGSRFSKEIEQALKGADVVMVLWSRASVESGWVQDEAAEGRDSGRLVPVVIDDSKPPLGFRQYQAIDLTGWKRRGKNGAIDELHRAILATAGSPQPVEAAVKARRPLWNYRLFGVAAGLVAIVMAGLIYWFALRPTAADAGTLRVRLTEFQTLSAQVPRAIAVTLREELLSALGTDAIIIAAAGEEPKGDARPSFAVKASVRKVADRLRFTVHLISEKSGTTVWSETLERPAEPIDIAPRQVAVGVSQVLRCGLTGAARYGKPLPDKTLSLYLSYCSEHWGASLGKDEDPSRALILARRLTEAAPDFSPGWSGLAHQTMYAAIESHGAEQKALRAEATAAANRALKFDKNNSEAYVILAELQPPLAHRPTEDLYKKAVNVRPSDCGCEYVAYAYFLTRVGRNAEAIDALERAHEMIPLSAGANAARAELLFVTGRTEEARRQADEVLELWPKNTQLHQILVRSAFWTGRHEEALKMLAAPEAPFSQEERSAMSLALKAAKGSASKDAARVALLKLPATPTPKRAMVIDALAALGADLEALSAAGQFVQQAGPWAQYVLFEPPLARARRTPQFAQIVQSFGLIRYWRESGQKPDFCKEASPAPLCASL